MSTEKQRVLHPQHSLQREKTASINIDDTLRLNDFVKESFTSKIFDCKYTQNKTKQNKENENKKTPITPKGWGGSLGIDDAPPTAKEGYHDPEFERIEMATSSRETGKENLETIRNYISNKG